MKVIADETRIENILSRSVANILPSKDALKTALMSGKRMRFYIGADPTGSELHIGHATNFILLEEVRQLGHEVIILFGDFTATIGDPTDKEATRKRLSAEEVGKNIKTWKKQLATILDFSDKKNPPKILKNSAWLSKLDLKRLIDLFSHFTVQQMVERDMFQKRLEEKKPIYIHEFFYPLLQGYDSVHLDVDVEVGGTDQTFNMLMGRTLQKLYGGKDKFVVATRLLEDPETGKKLMSKSEGKYIALSDSPEEMYGKAMALPDGVITSVLRDCTQVSYTEVEAVEKKLAQGENPKNLKMKLAYELVRTYHDEARAKRAEKSFTDTFHKGGVPTGAQEIRVQNGTTFGNLYEDFRRAGVVESKSDFMRLFNGGAFFDLREGKKITNLDFVITRPFELRIGKKRFLKISVI